MKQNQKNRYNGRYNNRNSRLTITRNTAMESSGPCGKLHGTALQLFEKYQAAAKDALIQNDLILAETCMQHADHYMRLQNIAIANEQAMRANNNTNNNINTNATNNASPQGNSMSVVVGNGAGIPAEIDELPVIVVPTEATEKKASLAVAEKKEPFPEMKETVRMESDSKIVVEKQDLSVPVAAIQEKHKEVKTVTRGRRKAVPKSVQSQPIAE